MIACLLELEKNGWALCNKFFKVLHVKSQKQKYEGYSGNHCYLRSQLITEYSYKHNTAYDKFQYENEINNSHRVYYLSYYLKCQKYPISNQNAKESFVLSKIKSASIQTYHIGLFEDEWLLRMLKEFKIKIVLWQKVFRFMLPQ